MDTVALLAWTTASLEDGDKHSLATSVIFLFSFIDVHLYSFVLRYIQAQCCYQFNLFYYTFVQLLQSALKMDTFRPWRQRRC